MFKFYNYYFDLLSEERHIICDLDRTLVCSFTDLTSKLKDQSPSNTSSSSSTIKPLKKDSICHIIVSI